MKVLAILLTCLVAVTYQRNYPRLDRGWRLHETLERADEGEADSRALANPAGRVLGLNIAVTATTNLQTFTSTVWVTSASFLMSVSIIRCVPTSLFIAGSSTVACRRRREFLDKEIEHIEEDESIAPSLVNQMTVTELPPSFSEVRELEEPIIVSSQDEVEESGHRQARNYILQYIVTVTSTTVSYSVSVTSWQSKAALVTTNQLSCMPFGYVTCVNLA